jgi:AmmeMemoRadiSam system protein A
MRVIIPSRGDIVESKRPAENKMTTQLTKEEKDTLLRIARSALEAAAHHRKLPPLDLESLPKRLRVLGASFVTLSKQGALRGCIGALNAKSPLAEDVQQHAVDAALYDHRFIPVQADETEAISIEVSVLTEPQPIPATDPEDIPKLLRPGVDGVIVLCGERRATFLPQVWKKVPTPEQFLAMLCQKAGLPGEAWKQGNVQILVYHVDCFHEENPAE